MSHNTINFGQLFNLLINSAYNACEIIQASSLKTTNISYKSQADPVTQIDHTIQKSIISLLQHKFSDIMIVGQQHIDETMIDHELLLNITAIPQKFAHTNYKLQKLDLTNVKNQDVCIFIDPLDCTRGYICGKKWECTVLIGVTVKGKPVFGVIGQPYKLQSGSASQFVYYPRIIVGGEVFQMGNYYQYELNQWSQKSTITESSQTIQPISSESPSVCASVTPLIAVSSRRSSPLHSTLQSHLNAQYFPCGGSGNKLAMLIRQQVHAVIFIQTPISTWDSCAGQAIVNGLGGILTKPDMANVQYDAGKGDQTNYQGFVCCLNTEIYGRITEKIVGLLSQNVIKCQVKQQAILI